MMQKSTVENAHVELVLPATPFDETLEFFITEGGFRLENIMPADAPETALISGHGLHIRLDSTVQNGPAQLNILDPGRDNDLRLEAPNGTVIVFNPQASPVSRPAAIPEFVITRCTNRDWGSGRAGMLYRDLIPGRQGGFLIGSHIRIPDAGPVPDHVHHHDIDFQMIYCHHGWVRVVYEDQGEPFTLKAGDCVLQPPHIRHRVLESSGNLEVIEFGSPASHLTAIDHDMSLPTQITTPDRSFAGQQFVRFRRDHARWHPSDLDGFEMMDTGIGQATDGLASVTIHRCATNGVARMGGHDSLTVLFVLSGEIGLELSDSTHHHLNKADCVVLPPATNYSLDCLTDTVELLRVNLKMPDRARQAS